MAESTTTATDLWEECFMKCGRDARIALECPCRPGRTVLCNECGSPPICPHCKCPVPNENIYPESGAPSTLPATEIFDGDSATDFLPTQFRKGDLCVVVSFASPPPHGPNSGYLQYTDGDRLEVIYIGTASKGDEEWIYAKNQTRQDVGWIEKTCVSIVSSLSSNAANEDLVGCKVRFQGLQVRQGLNGKKGIVYRWVAESHRWEVRLKDGSSVAVKEENLAKVESRYSEGLSRTLAAVLRHQAPKLGLTVREEGFVPVREVMRAVSCSRADLTQTILESMHEGNSHRFEEQDIDGELHIRARHGRTFTAPSKAQDQQRRQSGYPASSSSSNGTSVPETCPEELFLQQLERLSKLKEAGHLNDEEFLLAKQRIIK